MLSRLISKYYQWRFDRVIEAICNTPPITLGNESFTLLSMVHHRDVLPYLLAVKSFCRYLSPHNIVVVTDPSFTDEDKKIVSCHIQGAEFVAAESCRDPAMPIGGCWERLTAIADRVPNDYVIQLDADTVTVGDIPEVREAIQSNCSFVLGTKSDQKVTSAHEMAALARSWTNVANHVQVTAESALDKLPNAERLKYARGCAGFSGFARGSYARDDLRTLSSNMWRLVGNIWTRWGSEQFASNFMVANAVQSIILPYPKYCDPANCQTDTVFLHFIGYLRYSSGRYADVARDTLSKLAEAVP